MVRPVGVMVQPPGAGGAAGWSDPGAAGAPAMDFSNTNVAETPPDRSRSPPGNRNGWQADGGNSWANAQSSSDSGGGQWGNDNGSSKSQDWSSGGWKSSDSTDTGEKWKSDNSWNQKSNEGDSAKSEGSWSGSGWQKDDGWQKDKGWSSGGDDKGKGKGKDEKGKGKGKDDREGCRFFAKAGWCKNGDNCPYSHVVNAAAGGDWKCPQCGDNQFARNRNCRKCGATKPGAAVDEKADAEAAQREKLIASIKAFQNQSEDNQETWWWWCDINGNKDKYDPRRKELEFLQDFCDGNKVPIIEGDGKANDQGQGGKGGKGVAASPVLADTTGLGGANNAMMQQMMAMMNAGSAAATGGASPALPDPAAMMQQMMSMMNAGTAAAAGSNPNVPVGTFFPQLAPG